jgi:hypothetical protein
VRAPFPSTGPARRLEHHDRNGACAAQAKPGFAGPERFGAYTCDGDEAHEGRDTAKAALQLAFGKGIALLSS